MYRFISTQDQPGSQAMGARMPNIALPLLKLLFLASLLFANTARAQDVLLGVTSNGGVEGKGTAFSIKTDTKTFSIIKNFADWGALPISDLVRGTDGYLYGMTQNGGTYDHGTLFKISTTGVITVLKHFNLAVDGGYPQGSLIQAKDGLFYGMLNSGPGGSGGIIFKISATGVYTVVKNLTINTDGGRPKGRLLQATDGNFYGLNSAGGASGYGTIFRLTPAGTYTVLKSFTKTDGANPNGSLMQATDGAMYGMTHGGGTYQYGVIFKITMAGAFSVLRNLNAATDAAYPDANLVQGKDGWLYGLAPTGVNYNGIAFKINTTGTTLTILKKFTPATDGGNPFGSLTLATDGNFYGLTSISGGSGYAGTVFKMTPTGVVTVLKRFTEAVDGGSPFGSLIQSSDGKLYGMTKHGGKNMKGVVFQITTAGAYKVLANLNGADHGNQPLGDVAIGKDSVYFGVAKTGGAFNFGTIYKICGGVTTVVKSFNRTVDGGNPIAGLMRGKDGNFYGVAETGGTNGVGTIFRVTPAGTFTILRHMKGATDGEYPQGPLVQGADGYLYGITYSGGTSGGGTIFKMNTTGTVFTVLRHLFPSTDGNRAMTGLTIGPDGAFYGMTSNNTRFFKITAAGVYTNLKTLSYSTDGGSPIGGLTLGTDGNFYGTMSAGGGYSAGVIFKITPAGTYTKLRQLSATTDGSTPKGRLLQGSDGAFYGTTTIGGTYKSGTIFRILNTTYTVLRHLNIATDGGMPLSGFVKMPKVSITATPQLSVTTLEDVSKSLTLSGAGATNFTFTITTAPRNGTVSSGTGAARTYKPKANYNGRDSFMFAANVGCLQSAPAWVKIAITQVNDTPTITTITPKSVVLGNTLTFTVVATDVDAGQTKTFSLITPPTGATINATTGVFTWKPTAIGTYTLKVRVTDNGSPVKYREATFTVTVTAAGFVGTGETEEEKTGQRGVQDGIAKSYIYPNPVRSQFHLVLANASEKVMLKIFDEAGLLVNTKQYSAAIKRQLQVDVKDLREGTYFLQVETEKGTETIKFVKL